ncbi:Transcription elongation factor [Quillaja saponaria]|uniref:Transcription elongation factor n=1 Tax=Quillaja saponaria TaxID=32244 RepID=A0AAD7LF11_QUISA|nr:Transcription elongation factor [Quillaja saponaria]
MDLDDFRSVLETAGVDVWMFIDTAITVASLDYWPNGREINAPNSPEAKRGASPSTPQSVGKDEDEIDPFGGLFEDDQKKILEIRDLLEDPDQSEDSLVELLQTLADMDITFQELKETDIGRHVNRLRKDSSNDVRRLVKLLVRKWKEIVDEWVKLNQPGEHTSSALMVDGDSPPKKNPQNGRNQVPDFAFSPNPHNGSSGSDKNYSEPEPKPKSVPRKEAQRKSTSSVPSLASATQNRQREQRESNFDSEKLASARRRLQANYKEAENAKRQRTIQVMDIHEIPKPKNAFFGKNKGGGGGGSSLGRHW